MDKLSTDETQSGTLNMKHETREVMMGEGNGVASVTLFTFTVGPGPHASRLAQAVIG